MRVDLPVTPYLQLDVARLSRNCRRMAELATRNGVKLRPHLKTAKSADVARLATKGHSGALTVSTVGEARYFVENGFLDLTYAVGIVPGKLESLHALQAGHGAEIGIILDSLEIADAVVEKADALGARFSVYIEIDTGGGRGGVGIDDPQSIRIGQRITASRSLSLKGVLTHAGQGYLAKSKDQLVAIAEAERDGAVEAARRLRDSGMNCAEVSIGSTPTVLNLPDFSGVTEIRPGVYTLFDVDQHTLGVCELNDIACTVIASVIGHNPRSRSILIDAGALALSKDLSPAKFRPDIGYGLIGRIDMPEPMAGLRLSSLHQEHGLITSLGDSIPFDELPIGSLVRVFPNHVCLTAAPYKSYQVVDGDKPVGVWAKANEW